MHPEGREQEVRQQRRDWKTKTGGEPTTEARAEKLEVRDCTRGWRCSVEERGKEAEEDVRGDYSSRAVDVG